MHYHIYFGLKQDFSPKEIFEFDENQLAINKVMELVEAYGSTSEIEILHTEDTLGRFSTIIIPNCDYKITLHECDCSQAMIKSPKSLVKSQLN